MDAAPLCFFGEVLAERKLSGKARQELSSLEVPVDELGNLRFYGRYNTSNTTQQLSATMISVRNTVDRLDKPSAYYLGKARRFPRDTDAMVRISADDHLLQNKKRKFSHDRDDSESQPAEDPLDPLRNATTLYVGNLYGRLILLVPVCLTLIIA